MGSIVIVDGAARRTADVMMSPELYGLVSSEFVRTLNERAESGGGRCAAPAIPPDG